MSKFNAISTFYGDIQDGLNKFFYLMPTFDDKLSIIKNVRDYSISNILGDISDDEYSEMNLGSRLKKISLEENQAMTEMTLNLISKDVYPSKFISIDELDDVVFPYLDSISNGSSPLKDICISGLSNPKDHISSHITAGRHYVVRKPGSTGPGNSIIFGTSSYHIMEDHIDFDQYITNGILITCSHHISPNKVIVLRNDSSVSSSYAYNGVNLFIDNDKKLYCLFNTDEYLQKMVWFNLS